MRKFERPNFKVETKQNNQNKGEFIISPLERGFGTTLGNSLRRVMLSSMPGGGVFAVSFDGVYHEFDTIEGVVEDVTMLILNIKNIMLDINPDDDGIHELKYYAKGPCTVTAGDLLLPSGVEVINKDYEIAHLEKDAILDIKLLANIGRGYVSAEENKVLYADKSFGVNTIFTDALYSPIVSVNYTVEGYKADSNKDELIIEVETNGSLLPSQALSYASKILNDHLKMIESIEENIVSSGSLINESVTKETELTGISLDDIPELTNGTLNCLRRAGIYTVDEVISNRERILKLEIERFGQIALDNLRKGLKSKNIDL